MSRVKLSILMTAALLFGAPYVMADEVVKPSGSESGGVEAGAAVEAAVSDADRRLAEAEAKAAEAERKAAEAERKAAEAEAKIKAAEAKAAKPKAAASEVDALIAQGGDALVAAADKRHVPFKDEILKTKMTLNGGVHKDVVYVFDTYTKGSNRRAVRFEEPPEMRGMGVVIKGRSEVYARLPDSDKVRRVGTHSKRQSFYGSDWSMDDMSMITLGGDYDAKILDSEGTHVRLELTIKKGVDLPYPRLVIKIDKKLILIDYIEYYDDNGKYVKLQQRFDPKVFGGGFLMYSRVVMTDAATKHTTENLVLEEKINQNIPDDNFTKRWLVRSL